MSLATLDPEMAIRLLALSLLVLGGAVGSFLNVVVYRLPAGMSLITPGSHCPWCKHPIRWFDNVPVLGWILLRGHCRDCREPIAIRYPLVEAVTGGLFLLLGICEPLSGGANLPPPVLIWMTQLWGIYAYHLLLLCTLLAAALIQYDGHQSPWRLFLPALIVGLLAPAPWPMLHPVAAGPAAGETWVGIVDGLAGLVVGLLFGRLASGRQGDRGLVASCACVGAMLGWQAVCPLAVLTAAIDGLFQVATRRRPELRRVPAVAWLLLLTLAWILAWGYLVRMLT
jgi:leader peptidase (prepilin peptidase)/N-methyltransferase